MEVKSLAGLKCEEPDAMGFPHSLAKLANC